VTAGYVHSHQTGCKTYIGKVGGGNLRFIVIICVSLFAKIELQIINIQISNEL
jgi:hypothetical protein